MSKTKKMNSGSLELENADLSSKQQDKKDIDWKSVKDDRLLEKLCKKYNLSVENKRESNLKIQELARSVLLFENEDITSKNDDGKRIWYCTDKMIEDMEITSFDMKNKMIENITKIQTILERYDNQNLSKILRDKWLKNDGLDVYNDFGRDNNDKYEFVEKDFDLSFDFITGDVNLDSFLYLNDILKRLRQMNVIDENFNLNIQKFLQLMSDLVLFILLVIKDYDTIKNEIRAKINGYLDSMYELLDVEEYELIMNNN